MQTILPTPSHSHIARWRYVVPFLTPIFVLVVWQLVVSLAIYPSFLIPAPSAVWHKLVVVVQDGTLFTHIGVTLQAMLVGLLYGGAVGIILGYLIAKNGWLETLLSPIIVAFQSTPVVAYAPLLVIWFGTGITSKIVTCAVIVFFPMLMNTLVGVRTIPIELQELLRVYNASPLQTLIKLDAPFALPIILTGLKTSATLALIGAVVGEFVSSKSGLGFLVNLARNQYDTPLVFVTVLTMTSLALSLYCCVYLLERVALMVLPRSK